MDNVVDSDVADLDSDNPVESRTGRIVRKPARFRDNFVMLSAEANAASNTEQE